MHNSAGQNSQKLTIYVHLQVNTLYYITKITSQQHFYKLRIRSSSPSVVCTLVGCVWKSESISF